MIPPQHLDVNSFMLWVFFSHLTQSYLSELFYKGVFDAFTAKQTNRFKLSTKTFWVTGTSCPSNPGKCLDGIS